MRGIFVLCLAVFTFGDAEAKPKYPQNKCKARETRPFSTLEVKVAGVSDGDTIIVLFKNKSVGKVRLLSMDTPETHFEGKSQGESGERAHARLLELIPEGSEIRLEFDANPCDVYGRYLAFVERNGVDINRQMITEGLAANFCYAPALSRCEDYLGAALEAQAKQRSVFAAEKVEYPHEFRIRESGRLEAPFVGHLETKKVIEVRGLEDMRSVPPHLRVFFLKKSQVKAPFQLVH